MSQRAPIYTIPYELLVAATGSAALLLDAAGRVQQITPEAERLLQDTLKSAPADGLTYAHLFGRPLPALVDGASQRFITRRDDGARQENVLLRQGRDYHLLLRVDADPDDPAQGLSYYRLLAQHLSDTAVFLFDHDKRYVMAEGLALRDAGYSPDLVEGRRLGDLFPAAIVSQLEPLYDAALNGQLQTIELNLLDREYLIESVPVRDQHGISGGMLIVRDVARIRRAEQSLIASEARNRALIQANPDFLFVIDRNGRLIEFESGEDSQHARYLVPAQIVGANLRDTGIEDSLLRGVFRCVEAALTSRSMQTLSYEVPENGEVLSFEARFVALNDDEVLVILRDLSALKATQRELQARVTELTELSQIEALLAQRLDIGYVMRIALEAGLRLCEANTGFVALQEAGGGWIVQQSGHYDSDAILNVLDGDHGAIGLLLNDPQDLLIEDVTRQRGYVPLLDAVRARILIPLISNENLIGVLVLESFESGVFTGDKLAFLKLFTARIAATLDNARLYYKTEQQLKELEVLYRSVSKLEALKTDMIRIASHDLRAPLTVILNYAKMIGERLTATGDLEGVDYVGGILESAERMRRMTSDILSLERIEEFAENAVLAPVDLRVLVETVFGDHQTSANQKLQQLLLEVNTEQATVNADVVQIREAMANLISNAIKYTPERGAVRVSLSTDGDRAIFTVRDTGIGIPEHAQVRLFQPFYRVRSAQSATVEGTGLGLNLVKNIIERHGGELIFSSTYGEGSTFGFALLLNR
jgi:signal transduction histidine kinase/PAS domain-containing protein